LHGGLYFVNKLQALKTYVWSQNVVKIRIERMKFRKRQARTVPQTNRIACSV